MAEPLLLQALAAHRAGRLADAEPLYRAALVAQPDDADALHLLGVLVDQRGAADEAVALIGRAVALRPAAPMFRLNLANAQAKAGRRDLAVQSLRSALQLDPTMAPARGNLAQLLCVEAGALWQGARLVEGLAMAREAVAFNPALPEAQAELGRILVELGRAREAEQALRAVIALRPQSMAARSALLLSLFYRDDLDPAAIAATHRQQMQDWAVACGLARAALPPASADRHGPLRVGFLSADFRQHSVGWFLRGTLPHLDRTQIAAIGISSLRRAPDAVTAALSQACTGWLEIGDLDDDAAVAAICAQNLDVLVDLGGHTAGSRVALLARGVAPVQVSWLGYPGPTGLAQVRARLSDTIADPADAADMAADPVLRMQAPFLCYAPPPPADIPVRPRDGGPLRFGSFNSLSIISPTTVRVWAGVLAAVPGSRLVLKAPALVDPAVATELRAAFAATGIDPQRLDILPPLPDLAGHLAAYHGVDIALDTIPISGTTTTCEALWMGVPVVALRGQGHHARVSASILTAAGLPELVADTTERFVEIAAGLAADLGRLGALRVGLRAQLRRSALMDTGAFAARLTAALFAVAGRPVGLDRQNLLARAWGHRAAGATDTAKATVERVLAAYPEDADALLLLGVLFLDAGTLDHAEAALGVALKVRPNFVAAIGNLALCAGRRKNWPRARALLEQALARQPHDAQLLLSWSEALVGCGDAASAERALRALAARLPSDPRPWTNLAALALAGGQPEQALKDAVQAVKCAPADAPARAAQARALVRLGRASEAVAFARAGASSPELSAVLVEAFLRVGQPHAALHLLDAEGARIDAQQRDRQRASALVAMGRAGDAEEAFAAHLARHPDDFAARSNALYSLHYRDDLSGEELARRLRAGGQHWQPQPLARPPARPAIVRELGTRLRVGYLSPDFRRHAVASFFEPLLGAQDRQRIHITGFAEVGAGDAVTARLRALCDGWVPTISRTAEQVAAAVRDAGIDVLVELAGHTSGNRLDVMALRPAPVGVTWLGHPGTTGLSCFDWRVSDAICDPPAEDLLSSEPVWRMAPGFHCFAPPREAPTVLAPPCLEAGFVTFGCFNARPKLSLAAIAAMAGVLIATPHSRLLIKTRECGEADERRRLLGLFAARGVAAERLQLLPQDIDIATHLGRYSQVDIALDSLPYAGTTTTLEALWMGVPVVSLAGDHHASRVGASLLTQLGRPEWIAANAQTYSAVAAALAVNFAQLAHLRAGQRAQMAESSLCRSAEFAAQFESMLWSMADTAHDSARKR
jgi:predicted O-linked N-acetylglucosamine transferase (SPINDLY family)